MTDFHIILSRRIEKEVEKPNHAGNTQNKVQLDIGLEMPNFVFYKHKNSDQVLAKLHLELGQVGVKRGEADNIGC